jgi:hypothetical protein
MTALLSLVLWTTPAQATPEWSRLHYDHAEASSFLQSNWNKYNENYHPNYVGDDNPATAWVEGVSGQGVGETLMMPVSALSSARAVRLRVRNGYQKSAALLAANSAPRDVRVAVLAGGREVAATTASLELSMGWQELTVAVPEGQGLSAVQLQVLSVHEGSRYADTCISDVQVWVDSDVPYRAPVELARQKRLDSWISERVQTARWFASQPKELPYAATAFVSTRVEPPPAGVMAEVEAARAQLTLALDTGELSRRARTTTLPGTPDGLWWLDEVQDLLLPGNVSWFQTSDALAKRRSEGKKSEGWYILETRSNDRVLWRGDDRTVPAAVAWTRTSEGEERGPYSSREELLVEYAPDGRATRLVQHTHSKDELGEATVTALTRLSWTSGKITELATTTQRTLDGPSYMVGPNDREQLHHEVFRPAQ